MTSSRRNTRSSSSCLSISLPFVPWAFTNASGRDRRMDAQDRRMDDQYLGAGTATYWSAGVPWWSDLYINRRSVASTQG